MNRSTMSFLTIFFTLLLVFCFLGRAAENVFFGLKDPFIRPYQTFWAPVFINNFSNSKIRRCAFNISLCTNESILLGNYLDTAANRKAVHAYAVAGSLDYHFDSVNLVFEVEMDFSSAPLHYGSFEAMRFALTSWPSSRPLAPGCLMLTNASVITTDGSIIRTNDLARSVGIVNSRFFYQDMVGNVNEKVDSTVDESDAFYLLSCIAFIPSSSYSAFIIYGLPFYPEQADVNRNNLITSYDAALILQHSCGIIGRLPLSVPVGGGAPPRFIRAWLERAEHRGADVYRCPIRTQGVRGGIAAQLIVSERSRYCTIVDVESNMKGATIAMVVDGAKTQWRIAIISADSLVEDSAELLSLIVRNSGPFMPHENLSLDTVVINDVSAEVVSSSVLPLFIARSATGSRSELRIFDRLGLHRTECMQPMLFRTCDVLGRKVCGRLAPARFAYGGASLWVGGTMLLAPDLTVMKDTSILAGNCTPCPTPVTKTQRLNAAVLYDLSSY